MPNVCLEQEHKGTNVKKDLYLWWWLCYTISIESKKPQNGTDSRAAFSALDDPEGEYIDEDGAQLALFDFHSLSFH